MSFLTSSLRAILLVLHGILFFNFSSLDPTQNDWKGYLTSHDQWKKDRIENLKKPFGYLSMIGLHWLKEGNQSIGSASTNDILFPAALPEYIGELNLSDDQIKMNLESPISINKEMQSGDIQISSDSDGAPSMFNLGSHYWYVIKRGDRYGIRMKDTLSESRMTFNHMPQYEPKPEWVVSGVFNKYYDEKIEITNKVGITYESDLAGTVTFEMNGKPQELLATNSGDRLFIVFADQTNGNETYGGGRFLYIDIPDEGNTVTIDLNKVENPICALSDYATCPLPRPENYLKFKVEAGEKRVR